LLDDEETRRLGLQFTEDFVFENGNHYSGYMKKGKVIKQGYGIQIWPSGTVYEGNWENNVAHGKGKFTHVNGNVYEGMYIRIIFRHVEK
jgi:hypothetical protein